MLPMPRPSFFGPMPFVREGSRITHRFAHFISISLCYMMPLMIGAEHHFQIKRVIIEWVFVFMVNMISFRNVAIIKFIYRYMKPFRAPGIISLPGIKMISFAVEFLERIFIMPIFDNTILWYSFIIFHASIYKSIMYLTALFNNIFPYPILSF